MPKAYVYNPRIFILGPPASGKTTARLVIKKLLLERNINILVVGIEESLRVLCPHDVTNKNYIYKNDGSLILLKPTKIINRALEHLIWVCNENLTNGFLVEIAHLNLSSIITKFPNNLFNDSLILHIDAPLEKRFQRNLLRKKLKMPERIIKQYSSLSSNDFIFLKSNGANVISVDDVDKLSDFKLLIYESVSAWLDRKYLC